MARIDIKSAGGGSVATGVLQLQGGVAMDATLRNVADQNNTTSPLKLSTTAVQVVSPLRITTDDPSDMYLDCEDGATNNRFNITRNTASQQVNLNFASNPIGSTTNVGAIRTYVDGVNLSEVMTFREDGFVGLGTTTPISTLNVYNSSASVSSIVLVEQDTAAVQGQINQYRKNGSVNLTNGTEIGRLSFGGYFNSTYSPFSQVCSAIYGYYGGTGTDRVGGLRLITWNGGGASTRLQVAPDGKIGIGTTAASAKLQIVGDGSTSATTSLLVQNSGGNTSLQVTDDQQVTGYSGTQIRFKLGVTSLGQGVSTRDGEFAVGLLDASGASLRLLTTTTGFSYIDGYTEGAAKASNYPIVFGSRANNTGISVTGTTTQENGSQAIFGYAVNEASSLVTINSTTRGFLPPRMTNAQRAAITTPAIGLMVYCTDAVEGLYVYKSTGWTFVI